jgi:hypothetical protein
MSRDLQLMLAFVIATLALLAASQRWVRSGRQIGLW